jgi:flagellar biosynthesis/type III secretory pathway protein FliH
MMQSVDAATLLQAIDELVEYCKGDEVKLDRRLLWLSTFLRRAEVMPPLEKQRVQERLKMFDELLEQDEFVKKQRERGLQEGLQKGLQEGLQKGLQEGQIVAYQKMLVDIVKNKFPSLEDLAQRRAAQTSQLDALGEVINLVSAVNDENTARFILNPSSAA